MHKSLILASAIVRMIVGTYTENTGSAGIYAYEFNTETAEFEQVGIIPAGNPSFVIGDPRGIMYGVGEFNDGRQEVFGFSTSGIIARKPMAESVYADPCNIINTGKALVTSNYTGGSLAMFPLDQQGMPGRLAKTFLPSQIERIRVAAEPHMHCAVLSPDGRYLFATDLGSDNIYRFDIKDGAPDFGSARLAYSYPDGHPGPRHMVFSPDGHFAYVLCELEDTLSCFAYEDGELRHINSQSAYNGGGKASADLHFSADGRFLYTSHRKGEDGISIFKIGPNGIPSRKGFTKTGIHPRNFAIAPGGNYLLCACRDSDCIQVFKINRRTGGLKLHKTISIPAPVCILI